jgi:hypothetical protein
LQLARLEWNRLMLLRRIAGIAWYQHRRDNDRETSVLDRL